MFHFVGSGHHQLLAGGARGAARGQVLVAAWQDEISEIRKSKSGEIRRKSGDRPFAVNGGISSGLKSRERR